MTTGASIARDGAKRHKTGARISYHDSAEALTRFTVERGLGGVLRGKRYLRLRGRSPKHAKHCSLLVALGSFTHRDRPGANSFRFTGRIRRAALAPGGYTLLVVASDAGRASRQLTAIFRILG